MRVIVDGSCWSASAWAGHLSRLAWATLRRARNSASPSPARWRCNRQGLLCDEITSALDPEMKNEVLKVLEDLKREGLTLLLVTHEIGFARRAADRVVVLCDGGILEEGPPSEVLDNPRTERMKAFLQRVLG